MFRLVHVQNQDKSNKISDDFYRIESRGKSFRLEIKIVTSKPSVNA